MSYDVSNEEKEQAEKALICFDYVLKALRKATDHLNIMGTPFKDHPDIKTEDMVKYRAALRRFRDKVIENFESFKSMSFKCINAMDIFSSDTQTSKLVKSFVASIEEIEDQINELSKLLDNLESKTLIQDLNKSIDDIHKLCDEVYEIVDDRIINHIKTNIIGKNWIDGVSDRLQIQLEHKTPIHMELMKQRQDAINKVKN